MSLLIVERGPNAGTRIPLTVFPVTIGRDPQNDIVINDEECSRFHLRLKQRGNLMIIEDLESRNGTYINGDRTLNAVIKNGDRILIGNTELSYAGATPNIQLATEIMQFDMLVAEELGLGGPISLNPEKHNTREFKPQRLNQLSMANQTTTSVAAVKKIFELHGNILVIEDLEEASKTLLKSIGQLLSKISRASFFVWSDSQRQLIPIATKHFKKKQPFLLSQRAFEDVITRKQGILLEANSPQVTHQGRHRVILPMIQNGIPICLVHIESDEAKTPFPKQELGLIQALLLRCAPSFESLLLRRELDGWLIGMIETMIATVEAKDTYTRGHSERVSKYCLAIADELKLDRETKKLLMISALCHDIGKIGIPDTILKKASMLSAEEYAEMRLHPTIGADIVSHLPSSQRFISGVKYHHEKWDGTGYPDGLQGEDIPFFGRIVGLADVYDAMVSGRGYSGFMNQDDASERLADEAELFDPEILKAFQKAHASGALTLKTDTLNQHLDEPILENSKNILNLNKDKKSDSKPKNIKKQKKVK